MGMHGNFRERILNCAMDLFGQRGFRTTGIAQVCAAVPVSRRTVYRQFGSKEELVVAALEEYCAEWREWFFDALESKPACSSERLTVLFRVLSSWLSDERFRGCLLTRAVFEYPDPDHPIHRAAVRCKQGIYADLHKALKKIELPAHVDRTLFLQAVVLLFEGAVTVAQAGGDARSTAKACRVAKLLAEHG